MTADGGIDRDELPEVVIVVNGALGMSQGKITGQVFQAAFRSFIWSSKDFQDWMQAGTRTIVKVATTPAMFDRVCTECRGYRMCDEGFTEVEADSVTCFVSFPFLHKDRPKVLDNKKCPLL
jgi:peptidyl-tRNA hydrolase